MHIRAFLLLCLSFTSFKMLPFTKLGNYHNNLNFHIVKIFMPWGTKYFVICSKSHLNDKYDQHLIISLENNIKTCQIFNELIHTDSNKLNNLFWLQLSLFHMEVLPIVFFQIMWLRGGCGEKSYVVSCGTNSFWGLKHAV